MPKIFLPFTAHNAGSLPPQPPEPLPPQPPPSVPSRRIVIDPLTRIEGHLRIEAQVEEGRVTDAWSAAMMFRGLEIILKGRDPRDAWIYTQRICGV